MTSLVCVVVTVLGPMPQQPSDSDSATIAALEQRIEDAVVRRDTAFLGQAYAPEFRFKHSTGELQDRAGWLKAVAGATYHSRVIDSLDVEVHDDVALTTGRLHVRSESRDPRWREYTIPYARVYVRRSGHWLLLTHHSTGQSFGPLSP